MKKPVFWFGILSAAMSATAIIMMIGEDSLWFVVWQLLAVLTFSIMLLFSKFQTKATLKSIRVAIAAYFMVFTPLFTLHPILSPNEKCKQAFEKAQSNIEIVKEQCNQAFQSNEQFIEIVLRIASSGAYLALVFFACTYLLHNMEDAESKQNRQASL